MFIENNGIISTVAKTDFCVLNTLNENLKSTHNKSATVCIIKILIY